MMIGGAKRKKERGHDLGSLKRGKISGRPREFPYKHLYPGGPWHIPIEHWYQDRPWEAPHKVSPIIPPFRARKWQFPSLEFHLLGLLAGPKCHILLRNSTF